MLSVDNKPDKQGTILVFALIFLIMTFLAPILLASYFATPKPVEIGVPKIFRIDKFWDAKREYCFSHQESIVASLPASVQMIFKSYDESPLPTQGDLAAEMNTDLNHTTQWEYLHIPFNKRGYTKYLNGSLSPDANLALSSLKNNISLRFPAIVIMWHNPESKEIRRVTHARVVTGYNETGVFFHDPLYGPNMYMGYSDFTNLWNINTGYWAFIVKR